MKKKNLKIIIYYIIVLIFVVYGFSVGTGVSISDGGYVVTYNPYIEFGNYTRTESICWYGIVLKESKKYLIGDKDSSLCVGFDILEDYYLLPGSRSVESAREDFYGYTYYYNIVEISIFYIILFVILPLTYISLIKRHRNKKIKKNLEKLKELADMKEHGLLSEEEYTERKQILVEKAKNNI